MWDLYDAGVAAFLAGRLEEAGGYFTELGAAKPDDYPGALWLQELRATAQTYARRCHDSVEFRAQLTDQVRRSRAALCLSAAADLSDISQQAV